MVVLSQVVSLRERSLGLAETRYANMRERANLFCHELTAGAEQTAIAHDGGAVIECRSFVRVYLSSGQNGLFGHKSTCFGT